MADEKDVLDEKELEESFNKSLADLKDSIGEVVEENLEKAKKKKVFPPPKASDDEEDEEKEEDEDDDEEEEEEEEEAKSLDDYVDENQEAAAILEIEPYLRAFQKSIAHALADLSKSVAKRLDKMEVLTKSLARVTLAGAELQKSVKDEVVRIGAAKLPIKSFMLKGRTAGEKNIEVDPQEVLLKSRVWRAKGLIDLVEAGAIENRVNLRRLGVLNDPLDQKVIALVKAEEKAS